MDPKVPEIEYSIEGSVPLEVQAGSIVLLPGRFLHYSAKNTSDLQRHAYTLHIIEGS
jgi:phytanoyl-CoA hydroxylase